MKDGRNIVAGTQTGERDARVVGQIGQLVGDARDGVGEHAGIRASRITDFINSPVTYPGVGSHGAEHVAQTVGHIVGLAVDVTGSRRETGRRRDETKIGVGTTAGGGGWRISKTPAGIGVETGIRAAENIRRRGGEGHRQVQRTAAPRVRRRNGDREASALIRGSGDCPRCGIEAQSVRQCPSDGVAIGSSARIARGVGKGGSRLPAGGGGAGEDRRSHHRNDHPSRHRRHRHIIDQPISEISGGGVEANTP